MTKMTTEEAFVKVLQMHGIEHSFGIFGSAIMLICSFTASADFERAEDSSSVKLFFVPNISIWIIYVYYNIFFPPNKISRSYPSASIFNTSILLILLLMQKLSNVSVLILCEEKPLFKFKLSNFLLKFHNLSSLAIVFKDEPDDGKKSFK